MSSFPGYSLVRRDRLIQLQRHDAYKQKKKPHEPTVCPDCGAVFHQGRWQWIDAPANAVEETCSACHRINDDFPAGFVSISGEFFKDHSVEILNIVQHEGDRARAEHPFERIMKIDGSDAGIMVTTTGIHVARRIGEALHHAYHGELEFHYNDEENLLRVHWAR